MFFMIRKTDSLESRVELLVKILRGEGSISHRGKGISELFRYLVNRELERQGVSDQGKGQ